MALQKVKQVETGQTGNYWVIGSYLNDPINKTATLHLHLYNNRAGKIAGNSPMDMREMSVSGADWDDNMAPDVLDDVDVNPRKKLYPWLKANANAQIGFDLSDAVDIDPDV